MHASIIASKGNWTRMTELGLGGPTKIGRFHNRGPAGIELRYGTKIHAMPAGAVFDVGVEVAEAQIPATDAQNLAVVEWEWL